MSVAFQMLKPLCVEVTRTHKPADILQLRNTVVRLTEQQLQEMQTYLLFPLRLNIQQKGRLVFLNIHQTFIHVYIHPKFLC